MFSDGTDPDCAPFGLSPEYGSLTVQSLTQLRERGAAIDGMHLQRSAKADATAASAPPPPPVTHASIYVTQYDPGTYQPDIARHAGDTFDYRIGRPMFETTSLPAGWVPQCAFMDELWVPTQWGRDVFAQAGVPPAKLHVLPGKHGRRRRLPYDCF